MLGAHLRRNVPMWRKSMKNHMLTDKRISGFYKFQFNETTHNFLEPDQLVYGKVKNL